MRQVAEFWWDAINTHKISPRGMPAYDRNEANAVFMAGDCRLYRWAIQFYWGDVQRPGEIQGLPARSASASSPSVPNRHEPMAWERHLGLGPFQNPFQPSAKTLAKRMLSDMMLDEEGQRELWKRTGAPPPNKELWAKIAKGRTVFMQQLQKFNLGVTNKVRSALLLREMAGSTQGLLRCGDQGGDRQPRGTFRRPSPPVHP